MSKPNYMNIFLIIIIGCCLSCSVGSVSGICPTTIAPMCALAGSCIQCILCAGALFLIYAAFTATE